VSPRAKSCAPGCGYLAIYAAAPLDVDPFDNDMEHDSRADIGNPASKQLQRWADDSRAEHRPDVPFAQRREDAARHHNRVDSACHQIAAHASGEVTPETRAPLAEE
jgi:hypothetical protein